MSSTKIIDSYGDYPAPGECRERGVRVVPETLGQPRTEAEQSHFSHIPEWVWTQKLSPHIRVRPLVREFEEKGGNHRVTIPGLGVLTVGPSGWAIFGV